MFVERQVTKTTVKINKIVRFQCSARDSHRDKIKRKSKDLRREGQQKSGEVFAWPRRCLGKVLRAEKAIENTPKNYTKKKSYFEGPGTSFLEPFGRSIRPQNQKKSNTNFSIEFETPTVQKSPAGGAGFRPWDGLRATGFIYNTALHRFGPKPGTGKKTQQNAPYI